MNDDELRDVNRLPVLDAWRYLSGPLRRRRELLLAPCPCGRLHVHGGAGGGGARAAHCQPGRGYAGGSYSLRIMGDAPEALVARFEGRRLPRRLGAA